ncbi:MAG: hypothetical protein KBB39_10955 [Phycicoccus sp.]|nr:hypothetical protein [Phycicoccus sp.]
MTTSHRLTWLAMTALTAATLGACTQVPTTTRTTTTESAAATAATAAPAAPVTSPTPPDDPAMSALDLPAGVSEGSVEAALWEALMGPDGEYAASAAYSAVLAAYGRVEPYASIQAAEERHVGALIRQLARLGVAVPSNPYLGQLTAPDNLQEAAAAWAKGEVANVALYDRLLAQANGDPSVTRVLSNLRRASLEQHLPQFEAAAANGGTLGVA